MVINSGQVKRNYCERKRDALDIRAPGLSFSLLLNRRRERSLDMYMPLFSHTQTQGDTNHCTALYFHSSNKYRIIEL